MKIVPFAPASEPGPAHESGSKGRGRSPSAVAARGDLGPGGGGQGPAGHAAFEHAAPVAPDHRRADQAPVFGATPFDGASATDAGDLGDRAFGAERGAPQAGQAEHAPQVGRADRGGEGEGAPERTGLAGHEVLAAMAGRPTGDGRGDELTPSSPAPSFAVELARSVAAGSKDAPPAVSAPATDVVGDGAVAEAGPPAELRDLAPLRQTALPQSGSWEPAVNSGPAHAAPRLAPVVVGEVEQVEAFEQVDQVEQVAHIEAKQERGLAGPQPEPLAGPAVLDPSNQPGVPVLSHASQERSSEDAGLVDDEGVRGGEGADDVTSRQVSTSPTLRKTEDDGGAHRATKWEASPTAKALAPEASPGSGLSLARERPHAANSPFEGQPTNGRAHPRVAHPSNAMTHSSSERSPGIVRLESPVARAPQVPEVGAGSPAVAEPLAAPPPSFFPTAAPSAFSRETSGRSPHVPVAVDVLPQPPRAASPPADGSDDLSPAGSDQQVRGGASAAPSVVAPALVAPSLVAAPKQTPSSVVRPSIIVPPSPAVVPSFVVSPASPVVTSRVPAPRAPFLDAAAALDRARPQETAVSMAPAERAPSSPSSPSTKRGVVTEPSVKGPSRHQSVRTLPSDERSAKPASGTAGHASSVSSPARPSVLPRPSSSSVSSSPQRPETEPSAVPSEHVTSSHREELHAPPATSGRLTPLPPVARALQSPPRAVVAPAEPSMAAPSQPSPSRTPAPAPASGAPAASRPWRKSDRSEISAARFGDVSLLPRAARPESARERSQPPSPKPRGATFRPNGAVAEERPSPSRRDPIPADTSRPAAAVTTPPTRPEPLFARVSRPARTAVPSPSHPGTPVMGAATADSRRAFGTNAIVDKSASVGAPPAAPAPPAATPRFLRAPVVPSPAESSPGSGPRRAPAPADRRRETVGAPATPPALAAHAHAGIAPAVFAGVSSIRHAPAATATRSVLAPTTPKVSTRGSAPALGSAARGDGGSSESAASSARTSREGGGSGAGSTPAAPSPAQASAPSFAAGMRSHGGGVTPGAQQPAPSAPAPTAVPMPSQVRALHELAAADPSLTAAAIGKNAHIRLETGRGGDLTMHLRVNDGVADIEVGGAAADKLGMRSNELRRALAGEGLTLGQFLTRPADAPLTVGDDRAAVPMATSSPMTPATSASPSPPSPSSSSSSSSSPSSSSSSNQDHRQNQPWQGAESSESPGAASGVSATNGARARSAASSSSNEGTGVSRRGLHVTA